MGTTTPSNSRFTNYASVTGRMVATVARRSDPVSWPLPRLIRRLAFVTSIVLTALIAVNAVRFYWPTAELADEFRIGVLARSGFALIASGFVIAIISLWAAGDQRARYERAVTRLVNRRALIFNDPGPEALKAMFSAMEDRIVLWAHLTGLLAAPLGAGIWSRTAAFEPGDPRTVTEAVTTILVGSIFYLGGRAIGRAVFYGCLPLRGRRQRLQTVPGHFDRAAGLKPVGDLFLRQAAVLAIPAIYFSVWSLILSGINFSGQGVLFLVTSELRTWYLLLAFAFIAAEIAAATIPMLRIHNEMVEHKQSLLDEVDPLSHRLGELRRELRSKMDLTEAESVRNEISQLESRCSEVERMPTWPVSSQGIGRFAGANFAVALLPVVGQLYQSTAAA